MNATGLVNRPSNSRAPPTSSRRPAAAISDRTGRLSNAATCGMPKIFDVPGASTSNPVTMRNRPSARGVQAAKNVLANGMWALRVWPVMAPEHTDWASFSVTSQHVYELRAGYRLAEQVALHLVAAQQAQDLGLIFRFDALGNDRETHRMGQRNHRRNQRRRVGAVVDR